MLSSTWAKRENANPELSRSSTLESSLATGRENSTLKKEMACPEEARRTNEKHRCRARARQEGQHRKTGPGLSSMGEALSVKQDRKLAGEVEGA